MRTPRTGVGVGVAVWLGAGGVASAQISDLSAWTLVEDPPDASFSGMSTAAQATLSASGGPVPLATDVGFQSVDGATPAASTAGFVFDPASSFTVAIDYDLSFGGLPLGVMSFGFGVGTSGDGSNSAGVGVVTQNGAPFGPFGGAARTNNMDEGAMPLAASSTLAGTMFVAYDAVTQSVTIGAAPTPGAPAPTVSGTYMGVVGGWPSDDLLVSFFMRSGPILAWQNGSAMAVFDNLRVLEGAAKAIAPGCGPADITADGVCDVANGGDGVVSLSDFSCYLSAWSASSAAADITSSGVCLPGSGGDGVDLSDFSCYLGEWANGCP